MPAQTDFTPALLGHIQSDQAAVSTALMLDTLKIGRLVTGSWALQTSGVACNLFVHGTVNRVQQVGIAPQIVFQCWVPLATDVLPGDQIYVNSQLLLVTDTDKGITGGGKITLYCVRVNDASLTWFNA